jgi:hypothetical protein
MIVSFRGNEIRKKGGLKKYLSKSSKSRITTITDKKTGFSPILLDKIRRRFNAAIGTRDRGPHGYFGVLGANIWRVKAPILTR